MRQKISYGGGDYTGSFIFWFLIIVCVCCFFWWPTPGNVWSWWWWVFIGILFFWWFFALLFTPWDVYADDDEVRVRRPLSTQRFRMSDIESVQPYQVPSNAIKKSFKTLPNAARGHWGHYHDDNIGDYYAMYGKPDNTVLIKLKDGRQFVVGGSDAKALSDYINSKLG